MRLAAQIAGALFYGQAQDDGFPKSNSNVLDGGNIAWNGPEGDGGGVATDQTGSGTNAHPAAETHAKALRRQGLLGQKTGDPAGPE